MRVHTVKRSTVGFRKWAEKKSLIMSVSCKMLDYARQTWVKEELSLIKAFFQLVCTTVCWTQPAWPWSTTTETTTSIMRDCTWEYAEMDSTILQPLSSVGRWALALKMGRQSPTSLSETTTTITTISTCRALGQRPRSRSVEWQDPLAGTVPRVTQSPDACHVWKQVPARLTVLQNTPQHSL